MNLCWCVGISSSHPSPSVLIPALRTIGNIVTGDDLQTQVLQILHHHFSCELSLEKLYRIFQFSRMTLYLSLSSSVFPLL